MKFLTLTLTQNNTTLNSFSQTHPPAPTSPKTPHKPPKLFPTPPTSYTQPPISLPLISPPQPSSPTLRSSDLNSVPHHIRLIFTRSSACSHVPQPTTHTPQSLSH